MCEECEAKIIGIEEAYTKVIEHIIRLLISQATIIKQLECDKAQLHQDIDLLKFEVAKFAK